MTISTRRLVAAAAVLSAALAGGSTGVRAQGGAAGQTMSPQQQQQMAQMRQQAMQAQEKMFKELGVTQAQKTKLETIQNKYRKQIMAKAEEYRTKNPKADPMQMQSQLMPVMQPLYQKMQKELMAVFTPAQQAKIKKMEAEHMKKMGGAGRPN